jgi:hypothetical protein
MTWYLRVLLLQLVGLVLALAVISPVKAQPKEGTIVSGFVALGTGRSAALPDGKWEFIGASKSQISKALWDNLVFRNTDPIATIPIIIVRHTEMPHRWGTTICEATQPRNSFLINTHNTTNNQLLNKCSIYYSVATPHKDWLKNAAKSDWYETVHPIISHLKYLENESLFLGRFIIYQRNSRGIYIETFVRPPAGLTAVNFLDAYRNKEDIGVNKALMLWSERYMETLYSSFFEKTPKAIASVEWPQDENSATALSVPTRPANTLNTGELPNKDLGNVLSSVNNSPSIISQSARSETSNTSPPFVTAPRKALVIGNDSYSNVAKLNNAREDARTIAENLKMVGYQVTLKIDLNEKEMKLALRQFKSQVGEGDEVAIYYAGHGVQLASTNYLLPIDISSDNEDQIKDDAIQLQRILDDMVEKKAKFTLAMVDACRDNPFKSSRRSIGGRGLSPTSAATGQMIVFSAGNGQQALDKLGPKDSHKNGVFTRVFVKEMQKPGISIDRVVRNVRNEVVNLAKSVGHDQVPAIYDQVVGEFYFKQ